MEQTLSELRPLEQSLDADRSDQRPLGSRREALEATQTAWEDYRNERCRYEYTHAGRGTLAGPIASQCQLRLTAEHALFLQQRLEALSR